jgi:monoamine oxidase
MRTIVDATAVGLDITLDTEVTTIEGSDSGVVATARTRGGAEERHEASHVIVTAPLGVLKAGSISFSPTLPADKLDAIDDEVFEAYLARLAAMYGDIAGRVLFAGKHTSYNRWGTVDGAMRSGIREAIRLLDEPDIPLVEIKS